MGEAVKRKKPHQSKTLWLAALTAGLGAIESAAPGAIPPGPVLIGLAALNAVLRVMTTSGVGR